MREIDGRKALIPQEWIDRYRNDATFHAAAKMMAKMILAGELTAVDFSVAVLVANEIVRQDEAPTTAARDVARRARREIEGEG